METYIAAIAAAAAAAYITWFWFLTRTLSGPRLWPLVGNLPGLFANRNRMHDWFVHNLKQTGPAFTYQTCNLAIPFIARTYGCFTITCNPRNLEHVLRTRFENYPKGPSWQAVFHDLLGEGIFNSDGDTWVVQRKTAALEFTTRSLRQAMERWANRSIKDRLWPILDAHCKKHEAVDLQDLLLRLTFDNICGLTFGKDPETLSLSLPDNPFSVAFDTATEATLERFLYPSFVWRLKKVVGLGSEKKLKESLEVVTKYMTEAIKERMEKPSDDLLSRFLKKKDSKVTTSTLQYIALNFVLAGRDTSSVALSWFFYIIMQKPDIEKKITDEIVSVLKETRGEDRSKWKEEPLGYEELDRLVYLKAALTETLRLYPSVPQDIKYVVADDVLPDGTFVPAGSSVTYPIYSLGRMEGIWGEDCLEFKPERWLVEEDGGKLRFDPGSDGYRFVTFNAGPRVCLGKELAYLQMKAIASSVLMRFKLELVPGHKVEQKMSLTLFMKNGLKVYVFGKEI